jgi:hypothetical protein
LPRSYSKTRERQNKFEINPGLNRLAADARRCTPIAAAESGRKVDNRESGRSYRWQQGFGFLAFTLSRFLAFTGFNRRASAVPWFVLFFAIVHVFKE